VAGGVGAGSLHLHYVTLYSTGSNSRRCLVALAFRFVSFRHDTMSMHLGTVFSARCIVLYDLITYVVFGIVMFVCVLVFVVRLRHS
jgi:hypothetical protein